MTLWLHGFICCITTASVYTPPITPFTITVLYVMYISKPNRYLMLDHILGRVLKPMIMSANAHQQETTAARKRNEVRIMIRQQLELSASTWNSEQVCEYSAFIISFSFIFSLSSQFNPSKACYPRLRRSEGGSDRYSERKLDHLL
jgi:hypothetical protein